MINVAVIDDNGKSRMFLRHTLSYLGNKVRSYADVFYFSDYALKDREQFDALIYNISDSFTRDSYKSLLLLFELFKIPIIIVSRKKDIRLLRALNNMGVENYIINDSDGDLEVRLSVALNKLNDKLKLNKSKKKRIRFNWFVSSYVITAAAVLFGVFSAGAIEMQRATDVFNNDKAFYFRSIQPLVILEEVQDTVSLVKNFTCND